MANVVFSPAWSGLTPSLDLACDLATDPASGVTAQDMRLSETALSRYFRARQKKTPPLPSATHAALPVVARRVSRTHTDGTRESETPWRLGDDRKKSGGGWTKIVWEYVLPSGAGTAARPETAVVTEDVCVSPDGMQDVAKSVVEQLELIKSASDVFSSAMASPLALAAPGLSICAFTLDLLVKRLAKLNAILSDPDVKIDVDDGMMRTLQMARHHIETFLSRLSQRTAKDFSTNDARRDFFRIVTSVTTLAGFSGALTQWGVAAAFWHEAYLSQITVALDLDPQAVAPHESLRLAMANLSSAVDALVVNLTQNEFKEQDDGVANLMRQVERVFKSYLLFDYFFGDDEILDADMIALYLSIDVVLWVNSALGQLAFYDSHVEGTDHAPLLHALLLLRLQLETVTKERRGFNRHEWASQLLFGRILPSLEFMGTPSCPQGIEPRVWKSYLGMRQSFDVLLATVSESGTRDIQSDDVVTLLSAGTVAANAFVHCMAVLVGPHKTPAMQQLIAAWSYLLGDFIQPIDEMMRHLLTLKTEDVFNNEDLREAAQEFSHAITEFGSLADFADRDDGESLGAWAERTSQIVEDYFDLSLQGDTLDEADEENVEYS